MKTATVRELRNGFPRIEAWVHEGESVNISKRGRVIATLVTVSANAATGNKVTKPDIMARLRETWGSRVFTHEEVAAMRADELSNDSGWCRHTRTLPFSVRRNHAISLPIPRENLTR